MLSIPNWGAAFFTIVRVCPFCVFHHPNWGIANLIYIHVVLGRGPVWKMTRFSFDQEACIVFLYCSNTSRYMAVKFIFQIRVSVFFFFLYYTAEVDFLLGSSKSHPRAYKTLHLSHITFFFVFLFTCFSPFCTNKF